MMTLNARIFPLLLISLGALCLLPVVPVQLALAGGILLAVAIGNPLQQQCMKVAHYLLTFSVAALGAGMNLTQVLAAGAAGLGYTVVGITAVLAMGLLLAKLLRTERDTALLVSVGTAICGGSAIAATAPVVRARQEAVAMAFSVVFVLNAAALMIFPPIGHALGLTPHQFGLWAALAIHDTSSVVGAASAYGGDALDYAVVLKMARALWIFPLALAIGFLWPQPQAVGAEKPKRKIPWFILGFVAVSAAFTFIPALSGAVDAVQFAAKRGMCLTLFLIGSTVTLAALKSVGWRPLLLGLLLWFFVAAGSLLVIRAGIIG